MQQSKSNVRNKIKIILQWSTFFNVSEKDASRVSVCSPQGVSKKNVTTLVSILGDPGAISGAEDKVKTGGKNSTSKTTKDEPLPGGVQVPMIP